MSMETEAAGQGAPGQGAADSGVPGMGPASGARGETAATAAGGTGSHPADMGAGGDTVVN